MILLDTNVVSEPTKPAADYKVVQWLDLQRRSDLFITAINLGEMLQGIAVMPDGARKKLIETRLNEITNQYLTNPVLPFDEMAAMALAEIASRAKAKRYTMGVADSLIAAIALAHGSAVATRDTEPFMTVDIAVINPWEE